VQASFWKSQGWLPSEYQGGDAFKALQDAMDRAKDLHQLVAKALPSEVQQVFFAGDLISTKLYLYVDPSKPSWDHWSYSNSVGDGTVPIWSAAPAGISTSLPSFSDHATIFDDQYVVDTLKRLLNCNSVPPLIAATNLRLARTANDDIVGVSTIDVESNQTGARVGSQIELSITITMVDQIAAGQLSPGVVVTGPNGTVPTSLSETTTPADVGARVLRYSVKFDAAIPGSYSSRVTIPGVSGSYTRDVFAISDTP
jgi:hypothetical protein